MADYYASVGKMGIDKTTEGDQRTPLGGVLHHQQPRPQNPGQVLRRWCLALNYPNPLDVRRGKTGRGR